jgi:DNA-binding PadR family transcriptional regulator
MEIKNIKRILNSMFKKEHVTKTKVKTGRVGGPMNKYTITRSGKYYAERYIMPKAYSLINAYDFLIDRGYDPSDIREKRIIFVDMKDIAKGILKYNGIKV